MIAACVFASSPSGGATPPYGPPVAGFVPSQPSVPIFSTVYFYDTSTGFPTSWAWHLGDASGPIFAITQFPSYFFTNPGDYEITLVVTNEYGTDSFSDTIEVYSGYVP